MYQITDYTKSRAKLLGVQVKPSSKKGKKIDIIKKGEVIASVGDIKYSDYPHYVKERGLEFANHRRELYKIRHKKDLSVVGSNGWYASNLLW